MRNNIQRILLSLFISLISMNLYALSLKPNAPINYVVKEGDTVWDISNLYLIHPWEWPQLWSDNNRGKNPDQIFPGDIFILNKKTQQLTIRRNHEIVLKPTMVIEDAPHPIPGIPLQNIKPFLNQSLVFEDDILPHSPYIISTHEGYSTASSGDSIFVKGLCGKINQTFDIYRDRGPYHSPADAKIILGYGALYIGKAQVVRNGEPTTLLVTEANTEVHLSDRVILSTDAPYIPYFFPHPPCNPIRGTILSILQENQSVTGEGSVVVIDQGLDHNLHVGDVLAVAEKGTSIIDPEGAKEIFLPNEHSGELMIFRVFDHVSFGLIMRGTKPVHVNDLVVNP